MLFEEIQKVLFPGHGRMHLPGIPDVALIGNVM